MGAALVKIMTLVSIDLKSSPRICHCQLLLFSCMGGGGGGGASVYPGLHVHPYGYMYLWPCACAGHSYVIMKYAQVNMVGCSRPPLQNLVSLEFGWFLKINEFSPPSPFTRFLGFSNNRKIHSCLKCMTRSLVS